MSHNSYLNASFFVILFELDYLTACSLHNSPCPHCKSKLHWANYVRKPRLPFDLDDDRYSICFSLCCSGEGCRKRYPVPSVRFWNRYVYPLFIMILSSSVSKSSVLAFLNTTGINYQTLNRWKRYWRESFGNSKCWKKLKGHFPGISATENAFPYSLVAQLPNHHKTDKLINLMELLSDPFTGRLKPK